jgi:hypothetical protein
MEIPKERACTKCGVVKPLDDKNFYPQIGYKYGLTRWCRDCRTKYSVDLNKEKRDEYRAEQARAARGSSIDKYRSREFAREMKKYGTTVEWYRAKLIAQSGLCALCGHLSHHHGTLQRLQVDHSHRCCDLKTKSCGKCLRGLLCADCNILLSYLERFLPSFIAPQAQPNTWLSLALTYLDSYR